jgi:hypothetical protein
VTLPRHSVREVRQSPETDCHVYELDIVELFSTRRRACRLSRRARGCDTPDPLREFILIPRLVEHRARPSEAADQTFTRLHRVHRPAHALDLVVAIPGDEMSVVDDVLLPLCQLLAVSIAKSRKQILVCGTIPYRQASYGQFPMGNWHGE